MVRVDFQDRGPNSRPHRPCQHFQCAEPNASGGAHTSASRNYRRIEPEAPLLSDCVAANHHVYALTDHREVAAP